MKNSTIPASVSREIAARIEKTGTTRRQTVKVNKTLFWVLGWSTVLVTALLVLNNLGLIPKY